MTHLTPREIVMAWYAKLCAGTKDEGHAGGTIYVKVSVKCLFLKHCFFQAYFNVSLKTDLLMN